MAESTGPPDSREAFADLARRLAERVPPGLPGAAILLPFLEWQRMLLAAYQRALADPSLPEALEENARMLARTLLTAYLELLRSQRALRETLVREQTELVAAWGEALERLRVQLGEASETGTARDDAASDARPPRARGDAEAGQGAP